MNHAEYLCHSSGPWKKHKYFQKIGEGANAVYRYVKNADKNITGSAYKKEAEDEKERSEYANELAGHAPKALRVGRDVDNVKKDGSADFAFKSPDQWADSAAYHGRKAAEAEANYYSKSLAGKAEKAAKNAANKVKRRFKTTTKATVTDTMTGEKRTVDSNDPFYKSLEKATKKKKKLKHEGMYSSEYLNHAEEVARGQAKIDALFGR